MSDPSCVHQWQVAKGHAGSRMRACQIYGRAEQDPAWKLLFTEDKPDFHDGIGTATIVKRPNQWWSMSIPNSIRSAWGWKGFNSR